MQKKFFSLALLVILASVYALTIAPDITWANRGADGGDLIAAAATGGVAHPSGYPTYLILARLFQFIPVGTLAFRANLLSAAAGICAAWLVFETVSARNGLRAGILAALGLGLAPLVWSQALIAEVYTLHLFFIALLLYLSETKETPALLYGVAFGLGAGNHLTLLLLLPILFDKNPKVLFTRLAGLMLGLTVYLALPLRAAHNPPINWENAVTVKNFWRLVSGAAYQDELFTWNAAAYAEKIKTAASLLAAQFGWLGLFAAFIGAATTPKTRFQIHLIWIALSALLFFLLYQTADSFLYLLPLILAFSIWMGMGAARLTHNLAERSPKAPALLWLILMVASAFHAARYYPIVDASQDRRAQTFGLAALAQIPPGGVVIARGDEALFTLWYFRYALQERSDMTVISAELLQHEWYQELIRAENPDLDLPPRFMFAEVVEARNPQKIFCRAESFPQAEIICPSRPMP
ncbi:MAG: hypothetical protein Fur002_21340 [Anaerolineales bacterium]